MINKTKFLILFLLTFVFIGFTSCTQGTQNPDDNDDDQPVHIVTNLDTPTELKVEIASLWHNEMSLLLLLSRFSRVRLCAAP